MLRENIWALSVFECHFCSREHRDTSEGSRYTVGLDGVGVLAHIHWIRLQSCHSREQSCSEMSKLSQRLKLVAFSVNHTSRKLQDVQLFLDESQN